MDEQTLALMREAVDSGNLEEARRVNEEWLERTGQAKARREASEAAAQREYATQMGDFMRNGRKRSRPR